MAEETIILSAVEYLNTKPFIEGLKRYPFRPPIQITQDSPAQCSEKLSHGLADIGIVPLADYPKLMGFRRITDWGIAADGPVESVLLVANQPIETLGQIYLDYQSRTSNQLMRILLEDHFGYNPQLVLSQPGYLDALPRSTGAVVIGDRALNKSGRFAFKYDLSELWKEMTGLPFVFAVWVASERVDNLLEQSLSEALGLYMDKREEVAALYSNLYPAVDIYHYLTQRIQYHISPNYQKGLDLFLEKMHLLEGIH